MQRRVSMDDQERAEEKVVLKAFNQPRRRRTVMKKSSCGRDPESKTSLNRLRSVVSPVSVATGWCQVARERLRQRR